MSKLFLVTGGTGFIGRSLVRRLVKAGARVRVYDNDWRGASAKLSDVKNEIQIVEGDIRDELRVRQACRGVDTICHLAFVNGTQYFYTMPELVLEVGVLGMMNVLKGALHHNVSDLVTASSSEVYQTPPHVPTDETAPLSIPDPLNPRYSYGGGKMISELLTFNYGRKHFKRAMVFRPHNVYGPDMGWEHVIPQFVLRMKYLAQQKKSIAPFSIQGTGRETRSFVFIEDFTEGLMKVLSKGRHMNIYHIGTSDERSIGSVAREVARFYDLRMRLKPKTIRLGSVSRRCPDITKLKKLGFKPEVSFREGLFQTALWYDQNANLMPKSLKKEIQLHG